MRTEYIALLAIERMEDTGISLPLACVEIVQERGFQEYHVDEAYAIATQMLFKETYETPQVA